MVKMVVCFKKEAQSSSCRHNNFICKAVLTVPITFNLKSKMKSKLIVLCIVDTWSYCACVLPL